MAVVTLYMSDLDPKKVMFKSKKEADEHDRKLELAEGVSSFLSQQISTIDDELAETLGMLIAENKERLMLALKGKPQALFDNQSAENTSAKKAGNKKDDDESGEKIVSLKKS